MTIDPEGAAAAPYARRAAPESSVWYLGCLFAVLADSEDTGGLDLDDETATRLGRGGAIAPPESYSVLQ